MEMGFAVTIVPDSTVGFIMEKVDYVLVGAEAVVENGGIINKVRRHAHGSSFGAGRDGRALLLPFCSRGSEQPLLQGAVFPMWRLSVA